MKNTKPVLLILSLIFFSLSVSAQNIGRITGKVFDKETKEGAIGVNVILEGTRYGAATDVDGNYSINNVPPGTYSINISAIGYQKLRVNDVIVKNNLTTKQDIYISPTTLELSEEVVVTADRPLIQKDLTSTSSVVTSEELKSLPVENIGQVINLQAGVVGGHFRGGRSNEVAYLVDGVPVTNVYDNSLGISIENNTVRQVEVITGTFNAEYGQAMSGVVNTITKQGSQKYEFSLQSYVGNYYSSDSKIFRNLDSQTKIHSMNIQGNFSGPVPELRDLTFFISGRYYNDEGYYYGKRVYNITDPTTFSKLPTGDGSWIAMNPSNKFSGQGKLTYFQPDFNLSYLVIYDYGTSQGYSHYRLFAPDGRKTHYGSNSVQSLQLTYFPDANTFHKFSGSYSTNDSKGYLYSNPNDPRYIADYFGSPESARLNNNDFPFAVGGNEVDRYWHYTKSFTGQWTMTSQLNSKHKFGSGIEFKYHELYDNSTALVTTDHGLDSLGFPIITLEYPGLHNAGNLSYLQHPVEASAYIQDKMEYDLMIVNVGLRFDYFDPNTTIPINLTNPNNVPNLGLEIGTREIKPKYQISPRLGVSFPITDQGALHFSYGHFFQIPSFKDLYSNSEYVIASSTNTTVNDQIGNPDLKPQQTITYEAGLQQVVAENMGMELTVYYRDIRNLLGSEIINTINGLKYSRYINRDYGNVKGLVLSGDKQFANYWSLKIDYTYQIAEGNASDPNQAYYYINADPPRDPEKRTSSLDWDQRSTLNATLTVGKPGDWTVSGIFQYGSGFPYTKSGTYATGVTFINDGVKPATYNFDLRAEKAFEVFNYNINTFLLIYNVLNIENEYGVYTDTGRANRSLEIEDKILNTQYNREAWTENTNDPSRYSGPRSLRIGASINF